MEEQVAGAGTVMGDKPKLCLPTCSLPHVPPREWNLWQGACMWAGTAMVGARNSGGRQGGQGVSSLLPTTFPTTMLGRGVGTKLRQSSNN